jgi:hypothetical protein
MSLKVFRVIAIVLVVAVVVVGTSQILAKKPGKKTCPEPASWCQCPWYEDTVYCQKPGKKSPVCSYTNPCFARCAGYSDDECSRGVPQ